MFSSAKLKIKRAEQHIEHLQASLNAFLKPSDFYRLYSKHDAQAGLYVLTLEITKPLPDDIPLLIGDCVHNLRTALDHMACDLVTNAGGVLTKHTGFPIRETRQEVIAALNGEIKIAGADIVDLITNTIQPYDGGNRALWALHRIDIADKHAALIPVISVTTLSNVRTEDENHNIFMGTLGVSTGGRLLAYGSDTQINIQGNGEATCDILFQRGQVFEGQPVIPTLHQLAQLVAGIVQTIEQAYLARTQGTDHTSPASSGSHPGA